MAKGKKDFSAASAQSVYSDILGASQDDNTPDEVQEVSLVERTLSELNTQGKKGEKLGRINMAFTPENYDYIRYMARLNGQTMTQFVNVLVALEREKNIETYQKARALMQSL